MKITNIKGKIMVAVEPPAIARGGATPLPPSVLLSDVQHMSKLYQKYVQWRANLTKFGIQHFFSLSGEGRQVQISVETGNFCFVNFIKYLGRIQ